MKTIVLIALLLWSGVASAEVVRMGRQMSDPIAAGAASVIKHTYQGSPSTLPYGHTDGWDPALVSHAQSMPSVQRAMDAMARRGYVRRADLDGGITVPGYANVVLAYEKPGAPVTERMPMITVITQPFYVSSALRWVPATQVVCGMLEDSAGVIRASFTPADSAIVIEGAGGSSSLATGALESAIAAAAPEWQSDESINYRYTAHDHFFPQDWRETTSRGMQQLWNHYAGEMGLAITMGALASAPGWFSQPPPVSVPRTAWSVGIAAWGAHTHFWMFPPDTTGRP